MAFQLEINLDGRDLRRLNLLAQASRLKAAQALTFTAERAIPAWRAANEAVFTLRRRAFIQKGVRLRAATPSNLVAQVGTIDRYMGRHTVGIGERKAGGDGRLFVPLQPAAQQGTHTQMRARIRGYDRSSRKTFLMHSNGKTFIVRRQGKSSRGLDFLAELMPAVKIRPRLDALALTSAVVFREFGPIYERLLLKWAEKG